MYLDRSDWPKKGISWLKVEDWNDPEAFFLVD